MGRPGDRVVSFPIAPNIQLGQGKGWSGVKTLSRVWGVLLRLYLDLDIFVSSKESWTLPMIH